jgi:D-alanine-D-alanine ligase
MAQGERKLRVGIVFGGRSGEHQISLQSARSIVDAIDRDRYDVTLIGIDTGGRWHVLTEARFHEVTGGVLPRLDGIDAEVLLPAAPLEGALVSLSADPATTTHLDVVFPALHGTFGEDGCIQGLLELAGIAYVGSGVLGSALGMDKVVQKRLLQAAGLPVVPFLAATRADLGTQPDLISTWVRKLGLPVFVKPANMGSSVGVSKVSTLDQLDAAVRDALEYDNKILVEEGIDAREIECAVLGNDDPEVSIAGEIRPNDRFYSYEAKYVDENGATLLIPAPLSEGEAAHVRALAAQVFRELDCSGMARVDFLLDRKTGQIYVNELNSIPGFTSISMYPKLWEASGVSYTDLISRLIDLAIERRDAKKRLRTAYASPAVPGDQRGGN